MDLFNQSKILSLINKYQKFILIFFLLVLSVGLIEALFLSPQDYLQGDSVRIMYVHVPSAWISLGIFSLIAFLSILVFIFKNRNLIIIAKSFAPSGFVFTLITLVTGSIWGKPTWGTWWAWDARITTMLILGLFYLMYLLAWRIFEDRNSVVKITSLISIIGAINIPIIKFSVDWWNTLHQPASVSKLSSPSIDISMLQPLLMMTLAFSLIGIIIAILRIKAEILIRKKYL